eukprot:GHVR01097211.1.p1 GENE.GHVR01097211.1~~GHVR01097211.1.p1  ORF type:complete len:155 (+),score=25.45 GHVR01097211.1:309-773(+)
MPTIIIFKSGGQLERIEGANLAKVKELVEKHAPPPVFSGSGQTLTGSGATAVCPPTGAPVASLDLQTLAPTVDTSSPSTCLLIRLPSGASNKLMINNNRTVTEVFEIISKAVKVPVAKLRILNSAQFPPKALEKSTDSLEDANCLASTLTVKYL